MIEIEKLLFHRQGKGKDCLPIEKEPDFAIKYYKGWMRPGFKEFLLLLHNHPRCSLSICSSMMEHNIKDVLQFIFSEKNDLEELRGNVGVFD
jgi:hypothetical protein